jgi:thymidylate synthase ThyX
MIQAKIICDSINSCENRITTFQCSVPKFLLAELNTHRMLSRNATSTRAVPLKKQIQKVKDNGFTPAYWGKNKHGMSASEEISNVKYCEDQWNLAKEQAINRATALEFAGLHKQIAGRLLEPFIYVDWLATSTDWEYFFDLRTSNDAQPEMQELAMMMEQEFLSSEPRLLNPGEWHIPFDEPLDLPLRIKVATARCARISYSTHEGVRDFNEDLKLHDQLLTKKHLSPFEHCAHALGVSERVGNFIGWTQYRKILELPVSFEEYLSNL